MKQKGSGLLVETTAIGFDRYCDVFSINAAERIEYSENESNTEELSQRD